jgi:hypothetical protein
MLMCTLNSYEDAFRLIAIDNLKLQNFGYVVNLVECRRQSLSRRVNYTAIVFVAPHRTVAILTITCALAAKEEIS